MPDLLNTTRRFVLFILFSFICGHGIAQIAGMYSVSLFPLQGQKLTKDNILTYQLSNQSGQTQSLLLRGEIRFKENKGFIRYSLQVQVSDGLFQVNELAVSPQYQFSDVQMERLFLNYGVLPEGEFSYCVELVKVGGEVPEILADDCLYDENQELFLISLLEPENKAKLHELYPTLSWTVSSPLISELTYNIRVAEIKEGQKANVAMMRNQPVYEEKGLRFLTQNYPVTAKPLEYFQPYAWTVDAYYGNTLMGSADIWEFVIIDDSLMKGVPREMPYIDIRREKGENKVYAIGDLKIKYVLEELKQDSLQISLVDGNNRRIKLPEEMKVVYQGDNRLVLGLTDTPRLKHLKTYKLTLTNSYGSGYEILFQYINPEFID